MEPTAEAIHHTGEIIRAGGLVILPTETVYGLAGDASNPDAVAKIFEAKGRPPENPLIVHIANIEDVRKFVLKWDDRAEKLATAFWPGPITLVLPKSDWVPEIVTAGLGSVAIRMPDHSVALDVILASGTALAMPSANLFMGLSPTRVEHLAPDIVASVELVLDGGPCKVGVESTVVDLTSDHVRVLRPGGVSIEQISRVLGSEVILGSNEVEMRSPGMYLKHYSPKSPLRLVSKIATNECGLTFGTPSVRQIQMPTNPEAYAARLYDVLFQLDKLQPTEILVESPPIDSDWLAIHDRLKKASA